MIEEKGYLDVLEAVAIGRQQGLNIEADFAGRWNAQKDAKTFDTLIQQKDLVGKVRAHGPITDRNRVQAFFLAADVFVLPTYYPVEAQPMTIIEAWSGGYAGHSDSACLYRRNGPRRQGGALCCAARTGGHCSGAAKINAA